MSPSRAATALPIALVGFAAAEEAVIAERATDAGCAVTPPEEGARVWFMPAVAEEIATASAPLVVAMASDTDRREVAALLEAGASGVIALDADGERMAVAARAVLQGLCVVPLPSRQVFRRPVLTGRQQEILSLVVLGLSNAEIAARLYLSESTVKTHIKAAFQKLKVSSRSEAVELILDPASGLAAGILGLSRDVGEQGDYAPPRLTS